MGTGKEIKIHPSNGIVIRYKGMIDIDSLYKGVKSWFDENRYTYFEKENTEKFSPDGNALKIIMNAEKEIDDYVQFKIEVYFVEIKHVKKLEKGYMAEARIVIRCNIILDYKNNWKRIPFMFYIYNNVILRKKIWGYYQPKAYAEMMDLNSLIKSSLGLI